MFLLENFTLLSFLIYQLHPSVSIFLQTNPVFLWDSHVKTRKTILILQRIIPPRCIIVCYSARSRSISAKALASSASAFCRALASCSARASAFSARASAISVRASAISVRSARV